MVVQVAPVAHGMGSTRRYRPEAGEHNLAKEPRQGQALLGVPMMPRKKKGPTGLFDVPVTIQCPQGHDVEVPINQLDSGKSIICKTCPREFWLTEEQVSMYRTRHGKRLDAIRRSFGGSS